MSGMAEILELGGEGRRFLLVTGVAMARLTPILQITPFLGGRHMGTVVRGALAFAMAMFLFSWLSVHAPADGADVLFLTSVIVKEALLGALLGFLASLFFYAASGVGFLVDNQRGLSMAQTTDPLSGEETSPLGSISMQTLVMVFVAIGGLPLFFQAILTTYAFWPPFSFWPDWSATALSAFVMGHFGWYLAILVGLAAPMLLVCFLVDFGMGLMNRFAPQMNVFFLAMPIKSGLSLALLAIYWAGMVAVLRDEVMRMPALWDVLRSVL